MVLEEIQAALRERQLDGWLFYDHHFRDPIAYRILGLSPDLHATRRWYYLIPAQGEPRKLLHRIEGSKLDALPGGGSFYSSWQEHEAGLRTMLGSCSRIAMQYSPRNAILYVSLVDAGTVELLRDFGVTVVSSADLVSRFEAALTPAQIQSHYQAQRKIDEILAAAWVEVGSRSGKTTEHDMAQWLREAMRRAGLVWEHGPNVSVNANTADSHYDPPPLHSAPIRLGDLVLIDIWGRVDSPDSCFYDVTWTAVVGRTPSPREQAVFQAVVQARDAAIRLVQESFAQGREMAGWQADHAAREMIREAGYAQFFTHRTGHNISRSMHGNGANLDNLETRDERILLPHTCFSVEPGVYLPEFGIRSEVNMMTEPGKALVTGRMQTELLRI